MPSLSISYVPFMTSTQLSMSQLDSEEPRSSPRDVDIGIIEQLLPLSIVMYNIQQREKLHGTNEGGRPGLCNR